MHSPPPPSSPVVFSFSSAWFPVAISKSAKISYIRKTHLYAQAVRFTGPRKQQREPEGAEVRMELIIFRDIAVAEKQGRNPSLLARSPLFEIPNVLGC